MKRCQESFPSIQQQRQPDYFIGRFFARSQNPRGSVIVSEHPPDCSHYRHKCIRSRHDFEHILIRQEAARFCKWHGLVAKLLERHQRKLATKGVSNDFTSFPFGPTAKLIQRPLKVAIEPDG